MAGPKIRATAEIGRLLRNLPAVDCAPTERARWLARKADVLDRIAAESAAVSVEAAELADEARAAAEHARRGVG